LQTVGSGSDRIQRPMADMVIGRPQVPLTANSSEGARVISAFTNSRRRSCSAAWEMPLWIEGSGCAMIREWI